MHRVSKELDSGGWYEASFHMCPSCEEKIGGEIDKDELHQEMREKLIEEVRNELSKKSTKKTSDHSPL